MLPRPITFLPCVFPCFSVRVVQCSIIIVHCAIRAPIPSVLALSHPSVPLSYQSALVGHPSPIVSIVLSQRSTAPLSLSVHCPVRVPSQCSSLLLRYFVVSSQYSCPTILHCQITVPHSAPLDHSGLSVHQSTPLSHHNAPLSFTAPQCSVTLSQCSPVPGQCSIGPSYGSIIPKQVQGAITVL